MALQDCIKKFEAAGAPIRDDQVRALQQHIAAGMTDEQAVRAVHLAAHQNVVDIASRAVNEGAVLAPVSNALTETLTFQAKALAKLNDKKEVLEAQLDKLNEEYDDISTVNSYFKILELPGKTLDRRVGNDLQDKHLLMDLMLHYSFKRPDLRKGAKILGLEGKDHMALMESFLKLQERREEIQQEFIKLDKEQTRLDEQVEVIWSGKKQTFYQSDITRLSVQHNMTSENLEFTDDLGGLAVPSLSVVKEGAQLTGFGEISFIGTESLGDPANIPIFDADGYTVRFPAPEYKPAKAADRDQLWAEVLPYVHKWEANSSLGYHMDTYLRDHPNPQSLIWQMLASQAVQAQFLTEVKGENLTPTMEDYKPQTKWALDPELVAFMDKHGDILNLNWEDPKRVKLLQDAAKVMEKVAVKSIMGRKTTRGPYSKEEAISIFRSGAYFNSDGSLSEMKYRQVMYDQKMAGTKELDTRGNVALLDARMSKGTNRLDYKAWVEARLQGMLPPPRIKVAGKWEEYNLENIVRAMKGKLKGKEFMADQMTEGLMRALASHRLTRMEQMRQRADDIIETDKDLLDTMRVDVQAKMNTWLGEVSQFYAVTDHTGYVDHFQSGDDARRAIVKWATTKGLGTAIDLEGFLNERGFSDIPDWLVDEGMEVAMDWLAVPVPYFEAKPQRAVMLEEFAGAVIPSDASPQVKAILAKRRIPYKEYQVGPNIDEQQTRADTMASFTEQLNKQGERTLFQSEIGFTSGLLTAARTMGREKGTAQEMMATLLKQPNVKKQELEWVGVEEWAQGMGSFTREELVKFIDEGGVQLKETLYAGERIDESVGLEFDGIEEPEEFADPEDDSGEPRYGVNYYEVRNRNDAFSEVWTVIEDYEAGNVSIRQEATGEWLDVEELTGKAMNNQDRDDASTAIARFMERQGMSRGAAGFARWPDYTLHSPRHGSRFGHGQDTGPSLNHREVVLHLPEQGGHNFSREDLKESHHPNINSEVSQEREAAEREAELFHYIEAFSPMPNLEGNKQTQRVQVFQIRKSQFATIDQAMQYIIDEKPLEGPANENHTSHAFPQSNIIAWVRMTDRLGPKGERILFVEEVQSDLHQAGQKHGYRMSAKDRAKYQARIDAAHPKAYEQLRALDNLGFDTGFEALDAVRKHRDWKQRWSVYPKTQGVEVDQIDEWVTAVKELDEAAGGAVPDMPFKGDAWGSLAMKRVIRMAADGGYDQIAWTTGAQQNYRYSLEEHYSKIEWDPRDEMLTTYDDNGQLIQSQHVEIAGLEAWIGAERVLEVKNQMDQAELRYEMHFASDMDVTERDINMHDRSVFANDNDPYVLVDENGELARMGGGSVAIWETDVEAREAMEDLIYENNIPTITDLDAFEGRAMQQFYDKLLVNVTNKAARKLDKKAKVRPIQMEGGDFKNGIIEGNDAEGHYVRHYGEVVSPRFKTADEAMDWRAHMGAGFANIQMGLDITPDIEVAAKEGQTYLQGGERASITFDATNKAVIRLTQAKDLSSFLHEMGHFYLEMVGDLAEMPDATPAIIDQYARMLTMMGVNSRREIGVEQHELLARSLEAYLREGKAPTAELQADFSTIRGWMIRVYRQIERLLGFDEQLNDETREMFDRMVATDEQIAASENYMGYVALYANAEEMGVTQRVFDAYRENMDTAHNEAVDRETEKMIKAMQWGDQQWWRDELKAVKAEVRAEAEAMNVYKALYHLQRGTNPDGSPITPGSPIKLSKEDLIARYGKDFMKRLPRPFVYSAKGGTDADIAAGVLGYGSGNELIQALIQAPKMEAYIKTEADRRMKERHPDPLNDADAIDRATREVHNEKRARVLAAELSALRKKQREDAKVVAATKKDLQESDRQARDANKGQLPKREDLAHIKAAAKELIESKRIRDVNPNVYLQAERKAGRLAFEAMANKKYAEAYEQKRKQIMNYEAYRAAVRAKAQAARDQKYLKGFESKRKRARMGKAGMLEQIDAILEGINFRKVSIKQIDRDNAMKGLRDAVAEGRMVVTPETLAKIMNENINWQEMTFAEFAGIRDVIKQLEHRAKTELEIIINGEKVIVQEAVDEVAESIAANNNTVVVPRGEGGPGRKASKSIREGIGHWLRSSSIARILDDADYGAVTQRIIEPIRRAYVEKLVPALHKATEDVAAIYALHYTNEELGQLGKPIEALTMGEHMSKSDILALALNWGSESNRAAVLGGMMEDAQGNKTPAFTEQGVAEALAKLDARDWAFVQDIWDYQNSYYGAMAETEKRRRGIAPQKIEALAFEIQTSDGQTVQVRGGYHHLQYNSEHGGKVSEKEFEDYYQRVANGQYISAHTRAGSTHERVQNHGKVVKLTLNTIDQNLREVIRDISIGDEINLVNKILHSKEVSNASRNTNTSEMITELKLWLSDAAVGELPAQSAWEKGLSWVRVGFTKSKLAFNVYVTALQLTGVFQSMAVIGTKSYGRGVGRFITNPAGNYKMVMEKSAFMEARYGILQTWDKDVQDTGAFLRSAFGNVPTKFKTNFDKMGHFYFYPIAKMQSVVDVTTWMGAHDKAINEMGLSEDKAILFADTQVEASQTSGLFSDRSGIERGTLGTRTRQSQFVRLWTTLISYMLAKGNIAYEKGAAFKKNPSVKDAVYLATDYILLFMIEGIASSVLYNNWPGDDDDDESVAGWVAKVTTESIVSGIPLVREYSAAKYGSGNTPVGALITDTWKFVEQSSQGEADEAFVKAGVKVAGTLFHLPASQVNRAVEAAMSEDDVALYEYITGKRDK